MYEFTVSVCPFRIMLTAPVIGPLRGEAQSRGAGQRTDTAVSPGAAAWARKGEGKSGSRRLLGLGPGPRPSLAPHLWSYSLLPLTGRSQFLPGQWLDTYVPDVPEPGGFTITSAPSAAAPRDGQPPPYLEVAVQESPGNAAAAWLWRPAGRIVGSTLRVRVGGSFVFPPPHGSLDGIRRVVFVAGGAGVNPLVSMLSCIGETPGLGGLQVRVLYATKMPRGGRLRDVLFLERIARLFAEGRVNGALRLHATRGGGGEGDMPTEGAHQVCGAVVDVRGGRLSGDELQDAVGPATASLVYICGPPAMTDHLVAALTAPGPGGEPMMDPGRVMTERWW